MSLSILKWYGGKHFLLKEILPRIPSHRTYVEPFGGAAHVLLNKKPSKVEVYNDIDENVVNLFRVLRDPEKSKRFKELIELTPYARAEFNFCRGNFDDRSVDDVERARRFYVVVNQSFGGKLGNWAYRISSGGPSSFYRGRTIDKVIERLRNVYIECDDFEEVIKRYDSFETFFYCDPPYILEDLKSVPPYFYIMSYDDHKRLVSVLKDVKGKVMLSGYRNELYDSLGWNVVEVSRILVVTNSRKNLAGVRVSQKEVLYMNYEMSEVV